MVKNQRDFYGGSDYHKGTTGRGKGRGAQMEGWGKTRGREEEGEGV